MKTRRYPFRYYGREPADWIPSPHGYLYDVQFERALDEDTRAAVRALAERHFARGPAALGQAWRWGGGGRFLVFAVVDRISDAPRMVFTQVTEFLSQLHHTAHLEDVVFCNGVGARSDRWDAWSLEVSPQPDPGPARPDEPWAALLRRPESPKLAWDAPGEAPAPPAPRAGDRASSTTTRPTKPTLSLARVHALPEARVEPQLVERRRQLRQIFEERGDGAHVTPVENASVPILWADDDAILCFDAERGARRIELPGHVEGRLLAVDPDGVRAVTRIGRAVYSIDLMRGGVQRKFAIHVNNGAITGLGWVVDDLWVERCAIQMSLHDFSDEDALYVGYAQPQGDLLGTVRNGTILVFRGHGEVSFVGVCDWQIKALGHVYGTMPVIVDDEVYVVSANARHRVEGLADVYEAWAAPLRRTAERNRARRMAPVKKKPTLRWHWRKGEELPPDLEKPRRDALKREHGENIWIDARASGAAVVALPVGSNEVTQSARMLFCPREGEPRALACNAVVEQEGLTNYSMSPDEKAVILVTGKTFHVHRARLDADHSERCDMPAFMHQPGLLFDIWAPSSDDLFVLWDTSLDWHRCEGGKWTRREELRVDGPRSLAVDRTGTGRFALLQQSRYRLKVFQWHGDRIELVAKFTDAVKRAMWREGRLYAQMTDGLWFELGGLPTPPPR